MKNPNNTLTLIQDVAPTPATPLEIYRRSRGFSRARLAELSSVHIETVGRIERREHVPHAATLRLLAATLGVAPDALRTPEADTG